MLVGNCADLVLIHGSVVHRSEKNTSPKSRFIYTFHMIESEKEGVKWAETNWYAPRADFFPRVASALTQRIWICALFATRAGCSLLRKGSSGGCLREPLVAIKHPFMQLRAGVRRHERRAGPLLSSRLSFPPPGSGRWKEMCARRARLVASARSGDANGGSCAGALETGDLARAQSLR